MSAKAKCHICDEEIIIEDFDALYCCICDTYWCDECAEATTFDFSAKFDMLPHEMFGDITEECGCWICPYCKFKSFS